MINVPTTQELQFHSVLAVICFCMSQLYSAAIVPQSGTGTADQSTPRLKYYAACCGGTLTVNLALGCFCGCTVQVVCRGQATVVFLDQQYKPIRIPVKVKETLLQLHQEYTAGPASS